MQSLELKVGDKVHFLIRVDREGGTDPYEFTTLYGSPREFGEVAILGGFPDFLKSDIFGVGDGHTAGFQ